MTAKASNRQEKRTFRDIRKNLLKSLANGQKNINQLSSDSQVNWRTTRNHMIHLMGFGFARTVVNLPQVKIYEITERGMGAISRGKI
jgi:predicted transcriptional regulator